MRDALTSPSGVLWSGHPTGRPAEQVTLRAVTAADELFLRRVYASARAEELALLAWSEVEKADFLQHQFEAQRRHYQQTHPDAAQSVICFGGEDIGRLYVARSKEEIRIVDIALLPGWRGRGIGTGLLRRLLEEARRAGQPVTLHVEKHNPALRLYTRLGFRVSADEGVYWCLTCPVGLGAAGITPG